MIRRPPRSTRVRSSAASDVYKRQSCPSRDLRVGCRGTVKARGLTVCVLVISNGTRCALIDCSCAGLECPRHAWQTRVAPRTPEVLLQVRTGQHTGILGLIEVLLYFCEVCLCIEPCVTRRPVCAPLTRNAGVAARGGLVIGARGTWFTGSTYLLGVHRTLHTDTIIGRCCASGTTWCALADCGVFGVKIIALLTIYMLTLVTFEMSVIMQTDS